MRANHMVMIASVLVGGGAVGWLGCGGADASDVEIPAAGGGGDGGSSGTAGSSGATGTTGSSGGSGASGVSDAGRGGDAADGSVVASGGSPADAGPGGDVGHLPCGSVSCFIPGETCCVAQAGNGSAYWCVVGPVCPASAGGTSATALGCSSAANCAPGSVCCVRQAAGGATSECKPTCAPKEAQLCDPKSASSGCTAGMMCSSNNVGDWGLADSFATCGGRGN